jgi:hypothetical protein
MAKGKFKSERQRRWMWANVPAAAKKWAHNLKTTRGNWGGAKKASARGKR